MHLGDREVRAGLTAGVTTYAIWGFFPLYFVLLREVGAVEILAHRVLWAAVTMVLVIVVTREWASIMRVFTTRRALVTLSAASLFIGIVWLFYGYGALTGRAVDVALGYFVCPLVTVVLAVLVHRETLRPAQWVAAAMGAVAVVVVTVGHGRFPWISCVIAVAFALYSLAKNRVRGITATTGLAVESAMLLPLCIAVMVWLSLSGTAVFGAGGWGATDLWLVLSGPVTVVPLLLFAYAASRMPLSTLGNLQYLNPAIQLAVAVVFLREEMPAARWMGFALVWAALAILLVDAAAHRRVRSARRAREGPERSGVDRLVE